MVWMTKRKREFSDVIGAIGTSRILRATFPKRGTRRLLLGCYGRVYRVSRTSTSRSICLEKLNEISVMNTTPLNSSHLE